jgi:hypothetical protein
MEKYRLIKLCMSSEEQRTEVVKGTPTASGYTGIYEKRRTVIVMLIYSFFSTSIIHPTPSLPSRSP